MRRYRLVLIIKRSLDKEGVDNLISEVKKWVGEVKNDKVTEMGEKKFAYKIKGEQSGNYVIWEFETEKVPSELERRLEINENILRHLLIRLD